ncbi:MAG: hypothetical protein HZB38_10850, partial [Planctomycetes bacterium]|nr:hypothetical protein [Planctomycetota bacterium]
AILLEDPRYRDGTIYRIHRAYPDGRIELKGVSADRWQLESGMFFYRESLEAARRDFEQLCSAGRTHTPPCRTFVHLTDRTAAAPLQRYVTAVIYPSEFDDDVAAWMLKIGFAGGDVVEGGVSHVTNYYGEAKHVLEREQLWSASSGVSRPAEVVLRDVRNAVQRRPA